MQRIIDRLNDGKVLVSDGAWGTFLQRMGLQPGDCPELWCVEQHNKVMEIARSYIESGSDMIETNSFGGSRFKLEHYGLGERTVELNEAAASISREAAGSEHYVLGSIGPTGKMLVMGDISESQLYDAFKEQATALEKGGVDAVCVETMSAADEASLAVKAARENTACEVICTFTFERTIKDEYRTIMGVSPTEAAKIALDSGAHIIGTNCGNGFERMIDIVKEIRNVIPHTPILVHANAGLPKNVDGVDIFPESPEQMAALVPAIIEAGANIIGGCCGTTPAHITAIKKAVNAVR
jgi:5-methyltetrahydrofolate--homocysteine methyltransferase